MDNILECNNLSKIYKNAIALSGVNLQIKKGRIVGLLGPNGSGKTTLIKLANGLLTPTMGEILIDGKSIRTAPLACKREIAYIPDNPEQYEQFQRDGNKLKIKPIDYGER